MASPTKTVVRSPFGDYMIGKMKEAGIVKFKDLSDAAGLTKSHPTLMACGYCHPSPTTARRLSEVLHVPYSELWAAAESSRREWGRRRRAGRCGRQFNTKFSFATSEENVEWLRMISERSGKSMSQTLSTIIAKARILDTSGQHDFYKRNPLEKKIF